MLFRSGAVSSYVGRGTAAVLGGENEASLAKAQADFEAALVLDEKSEDAWLSLIDVYIRRGDYDKALELAKEALEKTGGEGVKAKLEELESGNVSDSQNQMRRRTGYDGNGALVYWHDYTYNEKGQHDSVTSYDAAGVQIGYIALTYDENGNMLRSYNYFSTGEITPTDFTYNEQEQIIKSVRYNVDGTISSTSTSEYNSDGKKVREDSFSSNGSLSYYYIYEYNDQGQRVKRNRYGSNGELTSYLTYEYNERGQRVSENSYSKDGTLNSYNITKYDESGKSIGTDRYNADGTLQSSTVNE